MSDARIEAGLLVATPSQTVGPFFHVALTPETAVGTVQPAMDGDRLHVVVRVSDGEGEPVSDAMVEIWQAAARNSAPSTVRGDAPCGFGRLPTGEDGTCTFETVRPGRTPDGRGGWQAAHINVCLFARGLLRQLHTRLYFAGDPALEGDAVLALVPEPRRQTLVATRDAARPDRWVFHVRLQGRDETVFFDV